MKKFRELLGFIENQSCMFLSAIFSAMKVILYEVENIIDSVIGIGFMLITGILEYFEELLEELGTE